jgi:hypothetical protein
MAADVPAHSVGFPALLQWWRAPAFLHWEADVRHLATAPELTVAHLADDVHARLGPPVPVGR